MKELFSEMDQDRIGFLFSSFPLERTSVNAHQFDNKLNFWQQNIKKYLKDQNKVTFELKDMEIFRYNYQIPLCFERVFLESSKIGLIIDQEYFQGSMFTRILKFPFKYFKSSPIYIHLEILQELVQKIKSNSPTLILKEDLISLVKQLNLSEKDNALVMDALKNSFTEQNNVCSKTNQFPQKQINLLLINKSKNILSLQIKEIEHKISIKSDEIKNYLNQKQKALFILKQKKLLDEIHLKRLSSLHTIENILDKIEQAESEIEIINSYKLGSDLLKNILQHDNLQEGTIDNVFDELKDQIEKQNDIEDQIIEFGKEFGDEQSFEKELDDMIRKEEETVSQELLDQLAGLNVANAPPKLVSSELGATNDNHENFLELA